MVNEGVEEEIAFLFPRLEASAKRKRGTGQTLSQLLLLFLSFLFNFKCEKEREKNKKPLVLRFPDGAAELSLGPQALGTKHQPQDSIGVSLIINIFWFPLAAFTSAFLLFGRGEAIKKKKIAAKRRKRSGGQKAAER